MPKGQHLLKHGMAGTPTYQVWKGMRARCNNPNEFGYKNYGGRGIKICERWNAFENFFADMGIRPRGASIDRVDNNGHYSPDNCRWATSSTQNRNRRDTIHVKIGSNSIKLVEFAESLNLSYAVIRARIVDYGWSPAKAMSRPIGRWEGKSITHNGETRSMTEWAKHLGIKASILMDRLGKLQWPIEKALTPKLYRRPS